MSINNQAVTALLYGTYVRRGNVTRKSIMFLLVGFIVILSPSFAEAAESNFGPDEWHQYRMKGDKNAVFDNGADPLEFRKFETANEVRATPVIVYSVLVTL